MRASTERCSPRNASKIDTFLFCFVCQSAKISLSRHAKFRQAHRLHSRISKASDCASFTARSNGQKMDYRASPIRIYDTSLWNLYRQAYLGDAADWIVEPSALINPG